MLAAAASLASCKLLPPPAVQTLSAGQIQYELLLHLQRLGDLSGYIVDVTPDGLTVFVMTTDLDGARNDACTTPQRPTAVRQALEPAALHRAAAGFEAVNRSLLQNKTSEFKPYRIRHHCDVHGDPDWKLMSLAEVRAQTSLELQRIGELSRYIRSVEADGTIRVWSYSERDPGCADRLRPYPADTSVDKAALSLVERALLAANTALTEGRDPEVVSVWPMARCGS